MIATAEKTTRRTRSLSTVAKYKIALIFVSVFCILLFVEHLCLVHKYEMPEAPEGYECLYYSRYIYPEDTMSEIALETITDNEMNISVEQEINGILEVNNMGDSDEITAGNYIIVPYWVEKEEQ